MVVDVDVVDTKFIAASKASLEALKTAHLVQDLPVHVLIYGEAGVGKKTLAQEILPKASIIDGRNYEELLSVLQSNSEVIITHIENVANIKVVLEVAQKNSVRVVATASKKPNESFIEEFFSVSFLLPSLQERQEDVVALAEKFLLEVEEVLGIQLTIDLKTFQPDIRLNAHSLKKQLFREAVVGEITEEELMGLVYHFLYEQLGSKDDYKKFLHLYEVPLIKAGLKKFKSQLQLADKLGLNRNTLRKKISEHKEYLE